MSMKFPLGADVRETRTRLTPCPWLVHLNRTPPPWPGLTTTSAANAPETHPGTVRVPDVGVNTPGVPMSKGPATSVKMSGEAEGGGGEGEAEGGAGDGEVEGGEPVGGGEGEAEGGAGDGEVERGGGKGEAEGGASVGEAEGGGGDGDGGGDARRDRRQNKSCVGALGLDEALDVVLRRLVCTAASSPGPNCSRPGPRHQLEARRTAGTHAVHHHRAACPALVGQALAPSSSTPKLEDDRAAPCTACKRTRPHFDASK